MHSIGMSTEEIMLMTQQSEKRLLGSMQRIKVHIIRTQTVQPVGNISTLFLRWRQNICAS